MQTASGQLFDLSLVLGNAWRTECNGAVADSITRPAAISAFQTGSGNELGIAPSWASLLAESKRAPVAVFASRATGKA